MPTNEIEELVDQINAAEDEQIERLAHLYLLVAALPHGEYERRVEFDPPNGELWSNMPDNDVHIANEVAFWRKKFSRRIKSVT